MADLNAGPDLLRDLIGVLPERLHQLVEVVKPLLFSLEPFLRH